MTAPPPEPDHEQEWPEQPPIGAPIQDPVPEELQHQQAMTPYGTPAPGEVAPYQTFAAVRPGVSGVILSIKRPNTGAGLARLRVQIGDRLIPAEDGTVFVTLPPGRHTVTFARVGTKDTRNITIDVPPGRATPLYYAMPYWVGASSALSPTPVETPGVGSFAAFIVATLGGVLLFVAVILALGFLAVA